MHRFLRRSLPVLALALVAAVSPAEEQPAFPPDPAEQLFAGLGLPGWTAAPDAEALDAAGVGLRQTLTVDHVIPLPEGRRLYVQETFTPEAFLAESVERRAVLFLCGSVFRGNHWSLPAEGYDGPAMVARSGSFAYTVDYLGVGQSTRPAHGRDAGFDQNLDALRHLLESLRTLRAIGGVDLVGAGFGGSLAMRLGRDPELVRSVVVSAMLYGEPADGPLADPAFLAMLRSRPDGYFFIPGSASLQFMDGAPEVARHYVQRTQGGFYPVGVFLAATREDHVRPQEVRVPGLVIYGPHDRIAPEDDIRRLARDWGAGVPGSAGAYFVLHPEAGHAPRAESPEVAAWYWRQVLDFLHDLEIEDVAPEGSGAAEESAAG